MLPYHNDDVIKFGYNPVLNGSLNPLNAVGATDSLMLRTLDYVPTNLNTIYVSKLTGDDGNPGTEALPVATLAGADVKCVMGSIHNVIILDSETYNEWLEITAEGIQNIYAQLGETPTIQSSFNKDWYVEESMITEVDMTYESATFLTLWQNKSVTLLNGNTVFVYVNSHYVTIGNYSYSVCYEIRDIDGVVVKSKATLANYYINVFDIKVLSNGNWVVIYSGGGPDVVPYLMMQVYSPGGVQVVAESQVSTYYAQYSYFRSSVAVLEGKFVACNNLVNAGTIYTQYIIFTNDGTPEVTSGFLASTFFNICSSFNDNATWARCYCDNAGNSYLVIHNNQGGVLHTVALGTVTTKAALDMIPLIDGNILVVYTKLSTTDVITELFAAKTTYKLYGTVYDADGNLVTAETEIATGVNSFSTASPPILAEVLQIQDGNIYFKYGHNTPKYKITSNTLTTVKSETSYSYNLAYTCMNQVEDGILVFRVQSSSVRKLKKYGDFSFPGIKLTANGKFNGIKLTSNNLIGLKNLIEGSHDLEIRWSTIEDSISPHPSIKTRAADITGSLVLYNSLLKNVDEGMHAVSNSVDVRNSQFVRVLADYGLTVTGAGAGISVNHCDFARSNGGIKLVGNNGSEVIKNCIFHMLGLYSVHAETAVQYHHSINTSPVHNATAGASVISSNPHYINDGSITLDDLDLNLKTKFLGYLFNSPAIALADDDKNAGSLEVDYGDVSQTWSYVTVDKGLISVKKNPVGEVETEYRDGSVATSRDGYTEIVEITWEAIRNADFESLLLMYYCSNSMVRIYPDPVTSPNGYNTYTLIYSPLDASPKKSNKLSRSGVQGVVFRFKRAYNEGA